MDSIRNKIKILSTGEAAYELAISLKNRDIANKDIYYEYIAKKLVEFKDPQYSKLFLENFELSNQKTTVKLSKICNYEIDKKGN